MLLEGTESGAVNGMLTKDDVDNPSIVKDSLWEAMVQDKLEVDVDEKVYYIMLDKERWIMTM